MSNHFICPLHRAGTPVYWVLGYNSIASTTILSAIHQRGDRTHTYRVALKPDAQVPEELLHQSWHAACLAADAMAKEST